MGTSTRISDLSALGDLIKARRTQLEYTQDAAARLLGISRRLLVELEAGQRSVRFDTVLRILTAFGIDLYARPRRSRHGAEDT
jgi:transcriptional regulator with XRE-family HTH domain